MPVETLGWISCLPQKWKMKNCLSGELVDLLGLTDILGSLQANSVLQLQSFLDALVLCVFLYVLVLFTTYISARDSSLLVTRITVFPPWTRFVIFLLQTWNLSNFSRIVVFMTNFTSGLLQLEIWDMKKKNVVLVNIMDSSESHTRDSDAFGTSCKL